MAEATSTAEHATTTAEQTADEGGLAGVVGTFGLRGDLFAAQLINFLLVLAVLWRFAYRPIMSKLAEREKLITDSVKNATEIGKRLDEASAERAKIVAEARAEATKFIDQAVADTEARKAEMIAAAKREVERVIQKGKEQLAEERGAMLIAARKELVDIAVKAAAKILSDGLTEKKSQSLAEEMVRKLT